MNIENRDDGLYFLKDGIEFRLGDNLRIIADTRDEHGENWGRVVSFIDRDGISKEASFPLELLAGDSADFLAQLFNLGYVASPKRSVRDALKEYLTNHIAPVKRKCVQRIGWHQSAFVLPTRNFGAIPNGEEITLQASQGQRCKTEVRGTLSEWNINLGQICENNSRLILAVSAAFSAPLVRPLSAESGGFHFLGESSLGKTTALRLAASVYGSGGDLGYISTWRATSNGLEATALGHCDCLLILDELSQSDPEEAGKTAYMLANQTSKIRANRLGFARRPLSWNLLYLSSGEIGLGTHMAEQNRKIRAGQENRLVDIPADAGMGMGIFESLHDHPDPIKLANHIKEKSSVYCGTPIVAFLDRLLEKQKGWLERASFHRSEFLNLVNLSEASGQAHRVAARFSLVAAGGELAIEMGIWEISEGSAITSAIHCFNAWKDRRGGIHAMEKEQIVSQVRLFFERYGSSGFLKLHEYKDFTTESEVTGILNDRFQLRYGYVEERDGETIWYVLPEVFRDAICRGQERQSVIKFLLSEGHLIPGQDDSPYFLKRIPMIKNPIRCYAIKSTILH